MSDPASHTTNPLASLARRGSAGRALAASAIRNGTVCSLLLVCTVFTAFTAVGLAASRATAQSHPIADRKLVVGTKEAPPFAMQSDDGTWHGITIELWRSVARDLGYEYELRETDLDGLLDGVADSSLDAGAAALTITASRERLLDFTQPFYVAGLAIAVPTHGDTAWLRVVEQFFSLAFLQVVLGLAALLLIVGTLVYLFERKRNPEQFGGGIARGVGASFWWSAVTMTTVGYGDKAPQTLGGRLVGLVWMFTAVVIISSFTAAVTSSLTLGQLQGPVQGPEDLANVRVGTVANSTSAAYLDSRHIAFAPFDTPLEALQALQRAEVSAVVYDEPILRYDIKNDFQGELRVLAGTFERQYYGIAIPGRSPLREPLNRALLARITAPEWQAVLARYLGQ